MKHWLKLPATLILTLLMMAITGGKLSAQNEAVQAITAQRGYRTVTVSDLQPVARDSVIPAHVSLRFENGGFDVANDVTLTINGSIDAPLQQVFHGSGKVGFGTGRIKEIYPQWWGATGNGQTDDTAAIQAAINSISAGTVFFVPGSYAITGVTTNSFITLKGAGADASSIRFTPTVGACITLPVDCTRFRLEDMSLVTSGVSEAFGIDGTNEYVRGFSMENFVITGFKTGVYIAQGYNISLRYGYMGCYGQGAANGAINLKLGDRLQNKACTTTTIQDVYFTNAEINFYNRAAPCVLVRPIFETCQIGLDSYTRTTVIGPFWAGCKTAARMTDNGALFIGPFPTEHNFIYASDAERQRTSFLPDTFDSPMKLGPMNLTPTGEMTGVK